MTTEDLLFQDEIKNVVRSVLPGHPYGWRRGRRNQAVLSRGARRGASRLGGVELGVDSPVRHAGLTSGETVVDLGSGGGIGSILAARRVGPTGGVIGVDLL